MVCMRVLSGLALTSSHVSKCDALMVQSSNHTYISPLLASSRVIVYVTITFLFSPVFFSVVSTSFFSLIIGACTGSLSRTAKLILLLRAFFLTLVGILNYTTHFFKSYSLQNPI